MTTTGGTFALICILCFLCDVICIKWEMGSESRLCTSIFRQSKRETTRLDQFDPIMVWMGRPSLSLHVQGKYGPVPMPTVWTSFANVLYITSCNTDDYTAACVEFIQDWLNTHTKYLDRPLYVSGNTQDSSGGVYLFPTALALASKNVPVSGVIAGSPPYTPSYLFHAHRSFETANNMTYWSVDRAQQRVVCNGHFSHVQMIMHDIHLHYRPVFREGDESIGVRGSYEYELVAAADTERCYSTKDAFVQAWSTSAKYKTPHDEVYATLPSPQMGTPHFPLCGITMSEAEKQMRALLRLNITVVMYTSLYKSPAALCSFYISILQADATEFSPHYDSSCLENEFETNKDCASYYTAEEMTLDSADETLKYFNAARLDDLDTAWTHSDQQVGTIGLIQDGIEARSLFADDGSTDTGKGIVWIQLDSRFAPTLDEAKESSSGTQFLSKAVAIDILAHAGGSTVKVVMQSNILISLCSVSVCMTNGSIGCEKVNTSSSVGL